MKSFGHFGCCCDVYIWISIKHMFVQTYVHVCEHAVGHLGYTQLSNRIIVKSPKWLICSSLLVIGNTL